MKITTHEIHKRRTEEAHDKISLMPLKPFFELELPKVSYSFSSLPKSGWYLQINQLFMNRNRISELYTREWEIEGEVTELETSQQEDKAKKKMA